MATVSHRRFDCASLFRLRLRSKCEAIFLVTCVPFLFAERTPAQTPAQQFVYGTTATSANTSAIAGFSKDSQTGALTAVSGSPFNERMAGGFLAIDGHGKFLFVLNPASNNISMFQINTSSGALLEVPGSPFAAVPSINPSQAPATPVQLATDRSGQFLFVGYRFGNLSGDGAVNVFSIDAAHLQLVQSQSIDIPSSPIGLSTDPKSLHLYVGLGPNPTTGVQDAGTQVYSIDSVTGNLALLGSAGGGNETGRSIAVDPLGRFFFDGWGFSEGSLDSGLISPVDGTAPASNTLSLGAGNLPTALLVDGSGKFLYVSVSGSVFIYSINQTTGALSLLPGGPIPLVFSTGTAVADPMGPYIYVLTSSMVQGFQVDPGSGALTSLTSPPTGGQGILGITISGQQVQAASGPNAALFPASLDFGASTVNQPSITRIVNLVNTGNQSLSVNAFALNGTNAADFTATPAASCQPPAVILPNANCALSVVFTPNATGPRQAFLTATDNAPGSPQSMTLSGTGVPSSSAVTLAPGSVSFLAITQGTTGTSQNIMVTNSGTAKLNIFSVILGGANPNDFLLVNNCTGPVAINVSCTLSATFSPLGVGQRTASITITDDAPNSPQTVELSGIAAPAFSVAPAAGDSLSATVSAGQTAQFNLQMIPGTGFAGTVTIACSGAPTAATCTAPSSLQLANGNSSAFSVTVSTAGSATGIPVSNPVRIPPLEIRPYFLFAVLCCVTLLLCATQKGHERTGFAKRVAFPGVWATALLLEALVFAGCSSGSGASPAQVQTPTPPPVVTPSGTSTLTLGLSVTSANGKQLVAPAPVLLTLTVR